MALLFTDGFDKYGPANINYTNYAPYPQNLILGDWTFVNGGLYIVAPLSLNGQALRLATGGTYIYKTLAASYPRIIGGVRFASDLVNANGFQFVDSGTAQCSIAIETTGLIRLHNGGISSGTILGAGATPVAANSTHYLEWDITISATGAYNVYLDGVSIISGTGNTKTTANNSINQLYINTISTTNFVIDDLYLCDNTGTSMNAPLLTSPRIETQFPNADSVVQFSQGPGTLGSVVCEHGSNLNYGNNLFYVRPLTPRHSCTLNSISLPVNVNASNPTTNLRPIIYADSSNAPGTLIATGATVVGMIVNTTITMPFTAPVSLTGGTQYWLGFMADVPATNSGLWADALSLGRYSNGVTFASGAPSTAPTTSTGATPWLWGNVTGTGVNWYEVSQQPPGGTSSYVFDATAGQEDLYNFPAVTTPGAVINAVSMKAYAQKSDTGTRTVSLRVKSGATDSGGSLTGQALGTSFVWYSSYFPTDPNTSAAWAMTALNNATSGIRIDS